MCCRVRDRLGLRVRASEHVAVVEEAGLFFPESTWKERNRKRNCCRVRDRLVFRVTASEHVAAFQESRISSFPDSMLKEHGIGKFSALSDSADGDGSRDTPFLWAPWCSILDQEEDKRDYDMHRLAREEKLKGKKLRGKRKRKEESREKVRVSTQESALRTSPLREVLCR